MMMIPSFIGADRPVPLITGTFAAALSPPARLFSVYCQRPASSTNVQRDDVRVVDRRPYGTQSAAQKVINLPITRDARSIHVVTPVTANQ